MPNVVSLSLDDAKAAITKAGFTVGTTTEQASDSVEKGKVISQKPAAGTKVKTGTKITLVISSGKAEATTVEVPNLTGKSQADAEAALKNVGLVPSATQPKETNSVEAGLVFWQSVTAGTMVAEGTKIEFTVAASSSNKAVSVPNVVGMSKADAKASIENAKLKFSSVDEYSKTVASGTVISQSISAGSKVESGTEVIVEVSIGQESVPMVTVPDVMGMTWKQAKSTLSSAGLKASYSGNTGGYVTYQDVEAGREVRAGALVTVVLEKPVEMTTVPDVTGMTWKQAKSAFSSARLKAGYSGDAKGNVVSQDIAPGSSVEVGTKVNVVLESPEPPVEMTTVPDVVGMSAQRAYDTIDAAGLNPKVAGSHGIVVSQSPSAGTQVEFGTTVSLEIDTSDFE